jgi:Domain of unknown function (DUF2703)
MTEEGADPRRNIRNIRIRRLGSEGVLDVRSLPIVWRRLVSTKGETCERCSATQWELERAVATLEQTLRPLGLQPHLEITEIDEVASRMNPAESNRIWIAGDPIEKWLHARVGSSRCCAVCGESECRTVEVGGTTFEAIPERLILKAALIASSELLDDMAGSTSA